MTIQQVAVDPIDSFQEEYFFLSNFSPAPVTLDGVEYPTVEHAYQAAKFLDPAIRESIRRRKTPGAAKRYAYRPGNQPRVREDWLDQKIPAMRDLLVQKFSDPALQEQLLATAPRPLIEGNTWGDVFWGVCAGVGENHLGRLLMEIRAGAGMKGGAQD